MKVEPKEAHIRIGAYVLSEGQSMAVRVAVSSFLVELEDDEFRNGLGPELADAYKTRLSEVATLLARDAR